MKQITIRGIPDKIEKLIKKEAERKRVSLNKAFLAFLERAAGANKVEEKKVLHHDLDHLYGVWSRGEESVFKKNLDLQRKIDEDLWKKTE